MMRREQARPVWHAWLRRGFLAALVLAAAALWWMEGRQQAGQDIQPSATPVPTAYMDERLKRETAYERDVAALQALLESGAAGEATRAQAAQKLTELIAQHQNEIGLEKALLEAGYDPAVVIVQNGAVTVMLSSEMLSTETSAQILALCVAHAGVGAENVRVMALK